VPDLQRVLRKYVHSWHRLPGLISTVLVSDDQLVGLLAACRWGASQAAPADALVAKILLYWLEPSWREEHNAEPGLLRVALQMMLVHELAKRGFRAVAAVGVPKTSPICGMPWFRPLADVLRDRNVL
jgi:hypothetical protein